MALVLLSLSPSTFLAPIVPSKAGLSRVATIRADETTRDSSAPAGSVTAWQPESMAKLLDTLGPLTPKDDASVFGFDSFTLEGAPGTISSYEGPGAPNVAWCSGLNIEGVRAGLTCFCGPLTDVPHLVVGVAVADGSIELYIDWRPRADAAYDPAYATLADYPDPTDRNMFSQSSNRKDLADAFYTEDAQAWRDSILALGTPEAPLSAEQTASLSAGPCLIDMKLPLTDANAAAASDACAAAVDRWLGWMTSAGEMGRELPAGAKQTATYTRDTKVRMQHFGFLRGRYIAAYGEGVGHDLASADAGPLDEAYVGGGS